MGNPFLDMTTGEFLFCIVMLWITFYLLFQLFAYDQMFLEEEKQKDEAKKIFMDGEPVKLDEFEEHLS